MNPSSFDKRFYGIYRGIVANNNDPLLKNRLKVKVPQVTGSSVTSWASPCHAGNYLSHDVANGAHGRIFNSETSNTTVATVGAASSTSVTFDTNDGANGIYIDTTSPSKIMVKQPGTYYIGVTLQVYYSGAGNDVTFLSWFRKNNIDVVGSTKRATVKGSGHFYNFYIATTQDMVETDYIETNCLGSADTFYLQYTGSGTSPNRPAAYKAVLNAFCVSGSVPNIGDGVWVMYEGGDPNFPVWIGRN